MLCLHTLATDFHWLHLTHFSVLVWAGNWQPVCISESIHIVIFLLIECTNISHRAAIISKYVCCLHCSVL